MKTKTISDPQAKSLMIMFILGTSLLLTGDFESKQDTWISMLIAMAMFIPISLIYAKLLQSFPGMGLFQIFEQVYGKFIGKIFTTIYILYFFHIGALCIRNITEYVQITSLPETPQYITAILIGVLCIYIVNAGLSVLSLWAKFVLPTIIVLIITTFLLAIPKFNYSYLLPVLYNGWKPVINSAFSMVAFPFAESIAFITILNSLDKKGSPTKVYLSSSIIAGGLLLIAGFRNILLLGFPNLNNIYFPSHYATALIDIPGFVQRIELLISINLLLSGFIKIAVLLYASRSGIIHLFNLTDSKRLTTSICIPMIILSIIIYKNTAEMFGFIDIYKYYAIPFQLILPLITLAIGSLRKRYIKK